MKKYIWIIIIVVISSILVGSVTFARLTKAGDSPSQIDEKVKTEVIEKTQHNTETSDNFREEVLTFMGETLSQERHFVETILVVIVAVMTILFGFLVYVNYRATQSQLRDIENKLRIETTIQFNNFRLGIDSDLTFLLSLISLSPGMKPEMTIMAQGLILQRLSTHPIGDKGVQQGIINALDTIYKVYNLVPQVDLDDTNKKGLKDALDKYSEYPFLNAKIEEIKKALKI